MSPDQIIERERRWARPVGLLALAAAALFLVSVLIEQGGALIEGDTDAEQLRSVDANAGTLLIAVIARAVGLALLCAPLLYLFLATRARDQNVRQSLAGFAFIGPLLMAAQSVVSYLASTEVASDFVARGLAPGRKAERVADMLIESSSARGTAASLLLSGVLGMLIALVYIPRRSMRAGLLTPFWGTLAMALAVSMVILLPIALTFTMLWFATVGLMIAGWWPGARAPAWAAGEAIPWPKPGEEASDLETDVGPETQSEPAEAGPAPSPAASRKKRKRRR